MKRSQLIGVSVAGLSAVAAFVLMKGFIKPQAPVQQIITEKVKSTEVLVARSDIALGQIASESLFRWQVWPRDAVAPGFITKANGLSAMRELSGAIARSPIIANEPITVSKLIKPGTGGVLAAILPAGMRAISTKIKEETAVGRLILPNDHVDVLLTRRMRGKGGSEDHASDTLFRNVRVLAIGQQIETKEGKKTAEGSAATATLELTPRQTELLALANVMGEISLSLRSVADLALDAGPTNPLDMSKQRTSTGVRVLRYGAKSRVYGVN